MDKEAPKELVLSDHPNIRRQWHNNELALTSLSEATAVTLHQDRDGQGFDALKQDAVEAGEAGNEARKVIEKRIGRSAISSQNYLGNTKSILIFSNPHFSMNTSERLRTRITVNHLKIREE